MKARIRKLKWLLWLHGGVDIVLTHAAPEGMGDSDDPAHWGFAALRDLIEEYHPKYLIHGHVHMSYDHNVPREMTYGDTKVINAYERYVLEIPDVSFPVKHTGSILWKTPHKEELF